MSSLTDTTATVLVQEHSSSGFSVSTYRDRVEAGLQLIRSELCWGKTGEETLATVRRELVLMAIQYAIEDTSEDRVQASLDMARIMSGHEDRSKDCYQALGELLYAAGYRKVAP